MAQNRPAIPQEIQRAIFIEAGHRCACCGNSFPLERAHIVPWKTSRDHSADNLLCLCANCHGMADADWDRQTFYEYKKNPWVNRQNQTLVGITPQIITPQIFLDTAWNILSRFEQLQVKVKADTQNDLAGTTLQEETNQLCWKLRELMQRLTIYERDRTGISEEVSKKIQNVYQVVAQILKQRHGSLEDLASAIQSLSLELH